MYVCVCVPFGFLDQVDKLTRAPLASKTTRVSQGVPLGFYLKSQRGRRF